MDKYTLVDTYPEDPNSENVLQGTDEEIALRFITNKRNDINYLADVMLDPITLRSRDELIAEYDEMEAEVRTPGNTMAAALVSVVHREVMDLKNGTGGRLTGQAHLR